MNNFKITIYTPESSLKNPANMFRNMIHDLIHGRELSWQLAVRDIRAQYRQTALGLIWAFILPLAQTITWIFLRGSGIVSVNATSLPYPVYVFTGTMLWAIFMDAVNAPLQKTIAAKQMLAKVNFPREALVVSGIYNALFDGGIKIVFLLLVLFALGIYPGWTFIYFPLGIISLIMVGTALGLLITPVGLLYSDIGKSIPLLMQFLMYLSPVVFPMPANDLAATIFNLNPMTSLILTTRDWLVGIPHGNLECFILINILVMFCLFVFWIVYRAAMPILIERMSA